MTTYVLGEAPVETHPHDQRVPADLGITPWDGSALALSDGADRQVLPVMPLVRDYIVQQKKVAEARVADLPALKALKNTWAEAEAASKPIRERRAAEQEQERWEPTPADVKQGREARTRHDIQAALAPVLETKLKALATLAQTVRADMDDPPSLRPTPEDMDAALTLSTSLSILTPQYAIPILLRQLVVEPAMTGKGLGRVTALLPIVQSLIQRDAVVRENKNLTEYGYASYAVQDIVTQAKAILQDASYYANHQTLQAIERARYKLTGFAADYAQFQRSLTPDFYGEVGVPPAPKVV